MQQPRSCLRGALSTAVGLPWWGSRSPLYRSHVHGVDALVLGSSWRGGGRLARKDLWLARRAVVGARAHRGDPRRLCPAGGRDHECRVLGPGAHRACREVSAGTAWSCSCRRSRFTRARPWRMGGPDSARTRSLLAGRLGGMVREPRQWTPAWRRVAERPSETRPPTAGSLDPHESRTLCRPGHARLGLAGACLSRAGSASGQRSTPRRQDWRHRGNAMACSATGGRSCSRGIRARRRAPSIVGVTLRASTRPRTGSPGATTLADARTSHRFQDPADLEQTLAEVVREPDEVAVDVVDRIVYLEGSLASQVARSVLVEKAELLLGHRALSW